MITEPSPWVTTTVFRLIAPTNTNMTRRTTVSLRDIVPPRGENNPGGILTLCAPMSTGPNSEPVLYRYTVPGSTLSLDFRPSWSPGRGPMCQSLVPAIAKSNGTLVPNSLVLASYASNRIHSLPSYLSRAEVNFDPILSPSSKSLKALDASFPKIGLLAERLDTIPKDSIALGITITFGRRSSVAERGSHNP